MKPNEITRPRDWAPGRTRFTRAEREKAKLLRAQGEHYKTIAILCGMSLTQAWRACQDRRP